MKWAYTYCEWEWEEGIGDPMEDGIENMNSLGQEGWELVNLAIYPIIRSVQGRNAQREYLEVSFSSSQGARFVATFKRSVGIVGL